MRVRGLPVFAAFAALLLAARPAGSAFGEARPGVTLEADVFMTSDPAAARLRFEYTGEGLTVTLPESALFRPGDSRLKDEALPALREVAGFLNGSPRNRVLVRGHSDSSGSLRLNLALSGARAARVRRFLAESGVAAGRLSYAGAGPARPVAPNDTEAGRARNRRVEIVVLRRES